MELEMQPKMDNNASSLHLRCIQDWIQMGKIAVLKMKDLLFRFDVCLIIISKQAHIWSGKSKQKISQIIFSPGSG